MRRREKLSVGERGEIARKRQIGRRIESGRRVCQNMRGTHRDSQWVSVSF